MPLRTASRSSMGTGDLADCFAIAYRLVRRRRSWQMIVVSNVRPGRTLRPSHALLVSRAGVSQAGTRERDKGLSDNDALRRIPLKHCARLGQRGCCTAFHDHRPQDGPCDRIGILHVTYIHSLGNGTGRHGDYTKFDPERGAVSLAFDVQDDSTSAYRRVHCSPSRWITSRCSAAETPQCYANGISARPSHEANDLAVWVARC